MPLDWKDLNWQDLVALGLVLLAVVYLGRQLWRVSMHKQEGGCGSCGSGGCSTGNSNTGLKEKPLVTIDSLTPTDPSEFDARDF